MHVDRAVHPIDRRFADSTSAGTAHGVAFGLIFILYLAIILAAQSVMAAVAEEKTSRIAEILVATISPTNLLVGKTLAAAAIAMVQIAAWLTTAMVVIPRVAAKSHASDFAAASASNNPAAAMPSFFVDPGVIVTFVVFFVLGYLQFATIYAAAASLISRTEDLGSVTTPLVMPVVGAFFIAQYSLSQPDAPVSVAFSFVPFVSPFVIFTRIAVSAVPAWQIALAIVINALAVAIAFYVSGKIYRVGMLLYGKMPSLKQIWAAIRT
ncbi:MAG: ABC transporter permease [Candidatus Eremiobacteraeota bacterium]|nr:ABC transporter permease [Candidatus Eremiobacteraeota bacterium]